MSDERIRESGTHDQGSRFVMMTGAKLLWSGMTGRIYVATRWKEHLNGTIEAVKKFDVTEEFHAIRNAIHAEVADEVKS